jgi:hypothetical protein
MQSTRSWSVNISLKFYFTWKYLTIVINHSTPAIKQYIATFRPIRVIVDHLTIHVIAHALGFNWRTLFPNVYLQDCHLQSDWLLYQTLYSQLRACTRRFGLKATDNGGGLGLELQFQCQAITLHFAAKTDLASTLRVIWRLRVGLSLLLFQHRRTWLVRIPRNTSPRLSDDRRKRRRRRKLSEIAVALRLRNICTTKTSQMFPDKPIGRGDLC